MPGRMHSNAFFFFFFFKAINKWAWGASRALTWNPQEDVWFCERITIGPNAFFSIPQLDSQWVKFKLIESVDWQFCSIIQGPITSWRGQFIAIEKQQWFLPTWDTLIYVGICALPHFSFRNVINKRFICPGLRHVCLYNFQILNPPCLHGPNASSKRGMMELERLCLQ